MNNTTDHQFNNQKNLATLGGFCALFSWSLSPLIISELQRIPTFQLSAILFFIAFLYSSIALTHTKRWKEIQELPAMIYMGALTILINQVAYIFAIKYAPPEQVEIIYYMWPILVILSGMLLLNHKKNIFPLISTFLGLTGIYILLTDGIGIDGVRPEYGLGYLLAFTAALAWAAYSLLARHKRSLHKEMNGIWCGLCCLACLGFHLALETPTLPTLYEAGLMAFMGLVTLAFSLKMWSGGMREGHFNTLNICSYMVPLFSILILMAAGKATFKHNLLISSQLIFIGSTLGIFMKWARKRKKAKQKFRDSQETTVSVSRGE